MDTSNKEIANIKDLKAYLVKNMASDGYGFTKDWRHASGYAAEGNQDQDIRNMAIIFELLNPIQLNIVSDDLKEMNEKLKAL